VGGGNLKTIMHDHHRKGFSLIELMIVLAVLAISLGLAAPSFQAVINTNRIASAANDVTAAIQLARSEAIRSNRSVVLCRSDDLSACTAGSGAWKGWIVFVDTDGSGQRDNGEVIVRNGAIDSPLIAYGSSNIVALNNRIAFQSDGRARGSDGFTALSGSVELCLATSVPTENARDVSIAFGGRTTLLKKSTSGVCVAPTDS
jgi:type IV fimbrial biogenesis protein FimT